MDTQQLIDKINSVYFYHRIDLGNGIVTPGWSPLEPEKYGIPDRMDGEYVLDVGAWDGYWTFEAIKRGAWHVLAIDDFSDTCGKSVDADRSAEWATFDLCREALGIGCDVVTRRTDSIERLPCAYQVLDRVFMFGVLYHLQNPVLGLTNCFQSLKPGGMIHVETAILDGTRSLYTAQPCNPIGCYAEFFANDEFGQNKSNWWVPTLKCAAAWLEAVGFVEIESWKLRSNPTTLAECRGFLRAKKPS